MTRTCLLIAPAGSKVNAAGAPPTACTPRDIESARKQPNESRRRRGRDRDGGIPVERYVESTSGFWTRLNLIETSIVATR